MATEPDTELPYIDEHRRIVNAVPARVWTALAEVFTQMSRQRRTRIATSVLGCADRGAGGDLDAVGTAIAGFHVAGSRPGEELRLEGRHRFSRYALTFRIDPVDTDRARLTAITHAAFPGIGRAYELAVVGTGLHGRATRGLLRTIAAAAERGVGR